MTTKQTLAQIGLSLKTLHGIAFESLMEQVKGTNISFIHLDFMNGTMVKSYGLSIQECTRIRESTNLPLEAHVMEHTPREMIFYRDLGIDRIVIHHESIGNKEKMLCDAKALGMEAGIALKPTSPHNVPDIIHADIVDLVVLMGTKSGSNGRIYDEYTPSRIKMVRSIYSGPIEVNGGVITFPNQSPETCPIRKLFLAGARLFGIGGGILNLGIPLFDAVQLNLNAINESI